MLSFILYLFIFPVRWVEFAGIRQLFSARKNIHIVSYHDVTGQFRHVGAVNWS